MIETIYAFGGAENIFKYKFIFTFSIFTLFISTFSFSNGDQRLIQAGHWVYDALFILNSQVKLSSFASTSPLTVSELKLYFDEIPYENLSSQGKLLYEQIKEFLFNEKFKINVQDFFAGIDIFLEPLLLYKTNKNIDWTFASDYTGKETYGKNPYGAASLFASSTENNPFISFPWYFGWENSVFIEMIPFFGKSFWGMSKDNNFSNYAFESDDIEFLQPRIAYGSIGKHFNKWGINLNACRSGLQIGKTQTGSIIYNSSFETDCYVQLNLYSPYMKYNMDVTQISKDKYIYIHSVEIHPIKRLTLGLLEGTLVAKPFEIRFLNPIMVAHSFGVWEQYVEGKEAEVYGEAYSCAYLGFHFDAALFKNFRIYGLYAQNELQLWYERKSANGKAMPDSLGGQLGMEFTIPFKNHGWIKAAAEGIYTSPFLYIKQGAQWSLYRTRYDMQNNGDIPICSWIGTPFGPDALGFQIKTSYSAIQKYFFELSYLFLAHGTNSFGLFNKKTEEGYYYYYPSVARRLGKMTDEQAAAAACSFNLTGIIQYTNQITAKGNYHLNNRLLFNGRITYSFVLNNKNIKNNFDHGAEFSVSLEYLLF